MIQINIQDSKGNTNFTLLFDIGQNATTHLIGKKKGKAKPQQ